MQGIDSAGRLQEVFQLSLIGHASRLLSAPIIVKISETVCIYISLWVCPDSVQRSVELLFRRQLESARNDSRYRDVLVQLIPPQGIAIDFNFDPCQLLLRSGGQNAKRSAGKPTIRSS